MRVLIDARKIYDGGIGDHIVGLVSGLLEAGVRLGLVVQPNTKLPACLGAVDVFEDGAKLYSFDELIGLPKRLPMKEFDVFHAPHYTLPYGVPIPTVVTIHDLIHVTHGQSLLHTCLALPQIISAAVRASGIFCVSKFTASELRRFCPIPFVGKKISIIRNMVRAEWSANSACPKSPPYILAVISTPKPHKGGSDLLTAWGLVRDQLDRHRLVLVGEGSEGLEGGRVESLGHVSSEEYSALFRGAEALVVPSLVEGFCVPALRGVYEGVPVIARPIPALRELLGSVGSFAESMSVEDLGVAIYTTVKNQEALDLDQRRSRETIIERCSRSQVTAEVLLGYQDAIKRWKSRV